MFPDHMWFAGVWFFSIFFLVMLIFLGFFLLRGGRFGSFKSESETPLDILKRRYVHGEISKEEFDRMKQDIS
ncbi:MAG: SHOCT domain-containing protein [Burkholderiales bacterium]|jgi:putative membrane protein